MQHGAESSAFTAANVKVVGAHAGLSVGPDGATHQALEDIAITRVLPNLTVVVPCDYPQTIKAVAAIAAHDGPCYLRFGRTKTPVFTTDASPFHIGRVEVLRDGDDLTLIGCGPLVYEALLAAGQRAPQPLAGVVCSAALSVARGVGGSSFVMA